MAHKDIDLKKIKELIEIMKQNGLEELEIKQDDDKIYLKRSQPQPLLAPAITSVPNIKQQVIAAPAERGGTELLSQPGVPQPAPHEEDLVEIKSPIVGTFYAKPSPDSEPYVEIGSTVGPAGSIGFIGLVAPHLMRPFVRYDPGRLMVPAALCGAALLLAADIAVRLIPSTSEIKVGVLTGLIGAPFFIALIFRRRRELAGLPT